MDKSFVTHVGRRRLHLVTRTKILEYLNSKRAETTLKQTRRLRWTSSLPWGQEPCVETTRDWVKDHTVLRGRGRYPKDGALD